MRKLFTTLLLVFLSVSIIQAQDVQLSQKLIDRYHSHMSVHNDSRVEIHRGECLTPLLLSVKKNWNSLTSETKDVFRVYQSRPALTNEQILSTDYFEIHYTTSGDDGVDPTDSDGNNVPDYVDLMGEVADNVFVVDIEQRGFTPPPPDEGEGGNNRYDIYISAIGANLYGFVSSEFVVGDNPESQDRTEVSAATSYMGMNNDYSTFEGTEEENIKVTLAHELSHSIDFGYSTNFSQFFLEAKGAWEEQKIYPTLKDNYIYLSYHGRPDIALDYGKYNGEDDPDENGRWYSGWLFFKHMTDLLDAQDPGNKIFKDFLERGYDYEDDSFMDDVLTENYNTPFIDFHVSWRYTMAFFSSVQSLAPYIYENADSYRAYLGLPTGTAGDVAIESYISFDGTAELTYSSQTDGDGILNRLAADYLELDVQTADPFQINFSANEIADMDVYLLGINSSSGAYQILESDDNYVLKVERPSDFDYYIVAIIRDDAAYEGDVNEQYEFTIGDFVTNSAPSVANQTFTIDENAANGSNVGTVNATDSDGNVLSFSFENASSGDPFAIDGSSGEISVTDSDQLNFEITEVFSYTVAVSDGSETTTATITILLNDVDECGTVSFDFEVNDSEAGGSTGSISISNLEGGTAPYIYEWSNGETGESISDLAPGDYTVTIIDVNLCVIEETFTVGTLLSLADEKGRFEVYPNPTVDYLIINGQSNNLLNVSISSLEGKVIKSVEDYKPGTKLKFNISPGIYLLNVNETTSKIVIE